MGAATDRTVGFFLVGARKCATGSLAAILRGHPEISISKPKEPNFFSSDERQSAQAFAEYLGRFDWSKHLQGDASTAYTTLPVCPHGVWERIYEHNPNAKILYIVREPKARILSNYRWAYDRGFLRCSLSEALVSHTHLVDFSRYAKQIRPYIDRFSREQVLILLFDDFVTRKSNVLDSISDFLGLTQPFPEHVYEAHRNDHHTSCSLPVELDTMLRRASGVAMARRFLPHSVRSRIRRGIHACVAGDRTLALSKAQKTWINEQLSEDIEELEKIIDRDLSHWRGANR